MSYLCLIKKRNSFSETYLFQITFDFSHDTNTTEEERQESFYEGIKSLRNIKHEELNDDMSSLHLFKRVKKQMANTKKVESCISILKV